MDEKETNVFLVSKPGVYSTLIASEKDEEGNENPFSVAIYRVRDHLSVKESHACRRAMLAGRPRRRTGVYRSRRGVDSTNGEEIEGKWVDFVRSDVLLTQTWPKDVQMLSRYKDAMTPISGEDETASRDVAEIASAICPRYHVVASPNETSSSSPENENVDQFFEREPYRNVSEKHATRFISLASVGNSKKQKWLHALGIEPGGTMNPIKLCQMPPDSTPSPRMAGVSAYNSEEGGEPQSLKRIETGLAR